MERENRVKIEKSRKESIIQKLNKKAETEGVVKNRERESWEKVKKASKWI